VWLWFTVVFANLAEAVAEGRGKAQARELRRMRHANHGQAPGESGGPEERGGAELLRAGDLVVIEAGELVSRRRRVIERSGLGGRISHHGRVCAGIFRESGGDRSAVTGARGYFSDRIVVKITANPGETSWIA